MFTGLAIPKAQAQWAVLDPANLGQNIWSGVKWVYDKFMKQAIALAFKEGLKMVLSQIAYDTATQIATGGRGQTASFWNQNWGDYLSGVGDAVLGQLLDDLSKEWGQFDICNPSTVNIKLGIHLSLFKERKPSQFGLNARCNFSEISNNWQEWAREVQSDPSKLYGDLRESFKPAENDAGMYLTLHSTLLTKEEDSRLNAWIERSVNQGVKDVASPITRSIKTPALLLGEKYASVDRETGKVEHTYTGEIVDSFLGTFTNTLMAKWMDQLFNKGFDTAQEINSQLGLPGGGGSGNSPSAQAGGQDTFAGLAEVNFTSSEQNIIDLLSLPDTNPQVDSAPGPTSEVVDGNFVTAVKAKMTLREAMNARPPLVDGTQPVGFLSSGSEPGYQNGYPYRSLVILRTQRIIPVGWELAAMYHKLYGETDTINFNYLTNCFEDPDDPANPRKPDGTNTNHPYDCRENTNGNDSSPAEESAIPYLPPDFVYDLNPYYHLVDPNWVLKAPETICNRQGPGPEVVYDELQCIKDNVLNTTIKGSQDEGDAMSGPYCESDGVIDNNPDVPVRVVQRNADYCGDWQSCILEGEDGSCKAYGYCAKEKPVWRFAGSACESYYNSCETFSDQAGNQVSYLRNTLTACDQSEAGCAWYSLTGETDNNGQVNWLPGDRLYLNQESESCNYADAGCTKLSVLKPGLNSAFNGDFSEPDLKNGALPLGWAINETVQAECDFSYNAAAGQMTITATNWLGANDTHCQLESGGLIPIDPQFTYQFSYKIFTGEANVWAGVGLTFYDANGQLCDLNHAAPCNTSLGQKIFGDVYAVPQTPTYKSFTIGPDSATGDDLLPGASYVKIVIKGPHHHSGEGADGPINVDDFQLTVIKSPIVKYNQDNFSPQAENYQPDYSQSGNFSAYLKVPPAYLDCEAYNHFLYAYASPTACAAANHLWRNDIGGGVCVEGGSPYCNNYTNLCSAAEVGCNGYTPINGGPEIPARITAGDTCPLECSGYASFLQSITYFDQIEEDPDPDPSYQNFIPATGQFCAAQSAGCEQFTNMDKVAKGGEGLEYFSYLRQCISANNPEIAAYYTWEGSDTTGYQLKKWSLLASNYNDAPCTHTLLDAEGCQDNADNFTDYVCAYPSADLNCRDFFNATGDHFAINQQYVITASGECHPYRRTKTGQIFNADPAEGVACPAAANNCLEYKGNAGNNIREAVNLDFEETNGTPGGVIMTNGGTLGLALSNEALYQGGHSLRVSVANDTIVYPMPAGLTAGKQYQLSFWAKKFHINVPKASVGALARNFLNRLASLLSDKAVAQNTNNSLAFIQANLTTGWQLYTLGPIELNALLGDSQLRLVIDDLNPNEAYYIDNIILTEYAENFYLIQDSWQTPDSCDRPYAGAQLGCSTYFDVDSRTEYLKSFDYICSPASIGCEAFINTQNSSALQGEEVWYGTCNSRTGVIADGACGDPAIPGSGDCCSIRGQAVCHVTAGEDACRYENATVPNDEIIYAVNDPDKACNGGEKGCTMVGQPELDRQYDIYAGGDLNDYYDHYVKRFDTAYIINDPDKYSSQLCSAGGLYCEMFTGDPDLTAVGYFFNPAAGGQVQGAGGQTPQGRTCFYDQQSGAWKKSGTLEPCSSGQFMPTAQDANYQGWVGLCDQSASTCTEYRDPEQPVSEKAEECDAGVSPQLSAICDPAVDGYVIVDGKMYCQKEINGVSQNVCTLYMPNPNPAEAPLLCDNINDCTPCPYTEHDWICDLGHVACAGQGGDCAGEYCAIGPIGDKQVCYVTNGQRSCNYSLACESYYYLHNSVEQCDGIIDREAGCMLFNDTSNPDLNFSADITADGQPPASPDECTPEFYNDGADSADCDSNTQSGIKVRKDRECAESLFCTSSVEITDADNKTSNVCLSLGRCRQLNPANTSECLSIVNSINPAEQTYAVHDGNYNPTGTEDIRNLSGFSQAGLIWYEDNSQPENNKIIRGNYPPEQMLQLGEEKAIYNAGFEDFNGALVLGWDENDNDGHGNVPAGNCSLVHSNVNPHSGTYALGLKIEEVYSQDQFDLLPVQGYWCLAASQDLYPLNPEQNYILSFYARSLNGAQRVTAVITYYENNDPNSRLGNQLVINQLAPSIWTYFSGVIGVAGQPIPAGAKFFRIGLEVGSSWYNQPGDLAGTVYFDDLKVAPALQISADERAIKECRLYPADNAPACEYTDNKVYHGWYGYCLESDPNNSGACLQWYPIDSVAGESLSVLGQQAIGYNGPAPLYYCLQAKGNYRDDSSCTNPEASGYCGYRWTTYATLDFSDHTHSFTPNDEYFFFSHFDYNYPNYSEIWGLKQYEIDKVEVKTTANGGDPQFPIIFSTYELDNSDADENSIFFSWFADIGESGEPIDIWDPDPVFCAGCVKLGVKIDFNSQGDIEEIIEYEYDLDGDGDNEDPWAIKLIFHLREYCTYVAETVGESGAEKTWFTRWQNGWQEAQGNVMGYNKNMTYYPYGAIGIDNIDALTAPLEIYSGPPLASPLLAGSPLSVPASVPVPERRCLYSFNGDNDGDYCADSSDCGIGGFCIGIGEYCYDQPSGGMTNGVKCNANADCSAPPYVNCNLPSLHESTPSLAASNRLLNLFAKIGNVWRWSGYDNDYQIYPIDDNSVVEEGEAPQVGHILLNGKAQNVNLTAPGGSVALSFTTDVVDDQLPIDNIKIKWNDGPNNLQNMDVSMYDRPSPLSPHRVVHTYSCVTNSEGNACVYCWDEAQADWVESTAGSCRYPGPYITIQDHWEFCPSTPTNNNGWKGEDAVCVLPEDGIQFTTGPGQTGYIYVNPAF